jgi:hypothetical protein
VVPFITRLTVAMDTRASLATSAIVEDWLIWFIM